jgi:chemotaxis protein histidine kinase CheA/ActR/RegA family two-component response regulator
MLNAFFEEMRRELALTEPDFAAWLHVIATSTVDASAYSEAVDAYSAQLIRIGQTAEMLGMPGLGAWCNFANEGLLAVSLQDEGGRAQSALHLARWPKLVDAYFAQPADSAASMQLVSFLTDVNSSKQIDEPTATTLLDMLVQPPVVPEELVQELAAADAPVIVSEEDVSLVLRDDADPDVYQAFIDEAPQNITTLSSLMMAISRGDANIEDIRNAKRIAHSFKGSANIVGVRGIASLGHHTEDILEHFEKADALPPPALSRVLVDAADCMAQMVGHLRGEEEAPAHSFAVLSDVVAWANMVRSGEIASITSGTVAVPESAVRVPQAARAATELAATNAVTTDADASLRVSVKTVDELFRLVSELTTKVGQMEARAKLAGEHAKNMLAQNLAVQQRVMEMEKLVVLRGLSLHSAASDTDSSFDPLEMDRYNELHGATRALVEVAADSREIASVVEEDIAAMQMEILQQGILNKDLQYQVTSTRLTPVSMLSTRLNRNVRQTGLQTGKDVELEIVGGDIQVDGDVLNKLADPLLHILRNAVDHGIEFPEERIMNGKAPIGQIKLAFQRQGSTVTVNIADDGRGFDYARIQEKAIARGLIQADRQLSEAELARLTLLPGFSTRDTVNEVSGRGVGMDVVANRMSELKGSVDISSQTGVGTQVTLKLQASLVTQHSLLVSAATQIFAIPTHNIQQAVAAGLGDVHLEHGALVFTYQGQVYPLRDLAALTGYPAKAVAPEDFVAMPKILISDGGLLAAVAVDAVLSSKELIVKSMGRYLQRLHGVAGASIIGDGTVVPILNVHDLIAEPLAITEAMELMAAEARRQAKRIVVVDDSVSVRKSLIQLFEDAAFEVRAAGDGLEAIRLIDSFKPHAVCTDLEMPNMNGLELTQHLRQKDATRDLPIVMITSRSMDKHREQAARAGVDEYVTKPYVDLQLMRTMRALVDREDVTAT